MHKKRASGSLPKIYRRWLTRTTESCPPRFGCMPGQKLVSADIQRLSGRHTQAYHSLTAHKDVLELTRKKSITTTRMSCSPPPPPPPSCVCVCVWRSGKSKRFRWDESDAALYCAHPAGYGHKTDAQSKGSYEVKNDQQQQDRYRGGGGGAEKCHFLHFSYALWFSKQTQTASPQIRRG